MRTYINLLISFLAFLVFALIFVLVFFKGHDDEFDQYISQNIQQLSSPNSIRRIEAVNNLAKLKERAKPALPMMALLLRDEVDTVAESTARALGSMGEIAAPVTPSLVRAMDDKRRQVKQEAVIAIGKIGPKAKIAKPRLQKALKDRKNFTEIVVIRTLVKIGEEKEVLAKYIREVQNDSPRAMSAAGILKDSGSEMGYKIGIEYIKKKMGGKFL